MNAKLARQVEEMKKQTIGVEVEMNSIARSRAAKIAADFFGTGRHTQGRGACTEPAGDEPFLHSGRIKKQIGGRGFMTEKYKGYIISTSWNGKTTGFDFRVRGENGTEAFSSEASYFYEENALKAAKKDVDEKTESGEKNG